MRANHTPIGVFDSGVGGLSVLREIRTLLPAESLLYVADSGHAPYGPKTQEYIQQRSHFITEFLLDQGAKAIVIACNTATAAAATALRTTFSLPIIGMEPAVKPAVAATRTGVVGVLATAGTLASVQFAALLDRFGQDVRVMTQACPGLVEQVERAEVDTAKTRLLVTRYAASMVAAGADTIVLGCTHYPFLHPLIQEVVGAQITLIDTGAAVARQVQRVLTEQRLLHPANRSGNEKFWTSGNPQSAQTLCLLWQRPVEVYELRERDQSRL